MDSENQTSGDAGNDRSGSRWEPDAETRAQAQPSEEPRRRGWRPSVPTRQAGVVGAAALLLVVSAGGGFAVGRATVDGHGHGDRVGLYSDHRGFDGGPGVGPGPLPPQVAPDDEQDQDGR